MLSAAQFVDGPHQSSSSHKSKCVIDFGMVFSVLVQRRATNLWLMQHGHLTAVPGSILAVACLCVVLPGPVLWLPPALLPYLNTLTGDFKLQGVRRSGLALQWTGDLSRMYHASCQLTLTVSLGSEEEG